MANAMQVNLQVGGVGAAVAGLNQVAGAFRGVNAAMGAAGVPRGQRQLSPALQAAQAQRQQAQIINSQLALQRAQARLARFNAPPPSLLSRLGALALSTRFNIGGQRGGVSPLVGRTLAALGITGEAAGMIGATAGAATIAITALKALADAAQEGGSAIKALKDAATITGSTPQEAARLRAAGIDPSMVGSLREKLATNPMAMLAAAQLGMRVMPRMFSSQDDAQVALELVDRMARLKKAGGDPLRYANMIGPEAVGLLPLINMSDKARTSLLKTADALSKLMDPKTAQAAADLAAANKRLELAGDYFKGTLFKIFGPGLTDLLNGMSDNLLKFSWWLGTGAMQNLYNNTGGLMGIKPTKANSWQASQQAQALNANTAALQQQTYLIRSQIYGGGGRGRGALPSGLNGMMLNQAASNHALRLGYWTL